MKYVLRPASEDDLIAMYNISRAAHQPDEYKMFIPEENWTRFIRHYQWSKRRRARYIRKMTDALHDTQSRVIVATIGTTVVGYTIATFENEMTLTLKGLFVRPKYQGQGVGKQLFQASYTEAQPGTIITLEVLADNERARLLYERQGFKVTGPVEKRFFGGQLVKMTKLLN